MLDGMLADDEEQHRTLLEGRPKSHVLDDALVARVHRVFTEQAEGFWFYQEQLVRWWRERLTAAQRAEVERLGDQLERLRAVNAAILALAEEFAQGTIEQVLAMSDMEAGLAWLTRQARAED